MKKRKLNLLKGILCAYTLMFSFLLSTNALAQDCGCDHTVEINTTYLDGKQLGVKPGDVICLKAGKRTNLYIKNLVGSSSNYITIKNCGGQVVLGGSTVNNGISLLNSRYVRITGTGVSGMEYGIKIDKTKAGSQGVAVHEFSSDVEIDHLDISGAGFAGIMAKTDPKCDGSADRGKFTMYNVKIHDNYIHDVVGEGIYLGNSFYNGTSNYCNRTQYPHDVKGVRVYNNIIKNTGWEGIQVGSASSDVEVYDNEIYNYGKANKESQNNGIQLGLGTTGKCYNNYIENGYGNGIVIQGIGKNLVYNNVIVGAGYPAFNVNVRPTPLSSDVVSKGFLGGVYIINNTIIDTKNKGAINEYVNEAPNNVFYNNLIVSGNSNYNQLKTYTSWKVEKNLLVKDVASAKFVNASAKDYRIQQGSPAIDAGKDISSYGITQDWERKSRKSGSTTDAGVSEFGGSTTPPPPAANVAPKANAGADQSIQLPTNSATLNGSGSDSDGSIASYAWAKVSGPSASMSGTSSNKLSLSNLQAGTYTFRLTVKDNKGASASDDVVLTVKEAAKTVTQTPVAEESPTAPPPQSAPTTSTTSTPSNLVAKAVSSTQINLSWKDNFNNETNYVVERSVASNFSSFASITVPANTTQYQDMNKRTGVTFYYRIRAVVGGKKTNPSNVASATPTTSSSSNTTVEKTEEPASQPVVSQPVVNQPTSDGNQLPLVKGSNDKTLTLPTNKTLLTCAAKDEDGFITAYTWTKVSGPSLSMSGQNTANFNISNLVEGTYTFRITATDNKGGKSSDDVVVYVVKSGTTAPSNLTPSASAPADKTITLPTNSVTLSGSGSDKDGSIASYQWTKQSGPSASLSGANTANLKVTNMQEGTYTFRLTVKDNKGASASDDVTVTVKKAATSTPTTSPTVAPSTNTTTSTAPIYRINAGGNAVQGSPIQWETDTREQPVKYLSSNSSNNVAGASNWNKTNKTQAPNSVLATMRFDFSWGGAMQYNLPLKSGSYEVRLYFSETPYAGGVKAAGERVFDIKMEGQTKVSGLDIYKEVGMNALQKTVIVNVTDGTLNIDFVRKVGNPQVNGIEILPASSNTRVMNVSDDKGLNTFTAVPEQEFTIYPNPVDNELNIRFGQEVQAKAQVELQDLNGRSLMIENIPNAIGTTEASFDLSRLNLISGVYLLKVQIDGQEPQVQRVMKN